MTAQDDSWRRLLTPETFRRTLIEASLFLAAYRILTDTIVDRIRALFTHDPDEGPDPIYSQEVLSRDSSPLRASLSWLKDNEAIDDGDLAAFDGISASRNEVLDHMPEILQDGPKVDMREQFAALMAFLTKVEKWWIINVDIPTNPTFDRNPIEDKDIIPGAVLLMTMLTDIAFGSDEIARQYLQAFLTQVDPRGPKGK